VGRDDQEHFNEYTPQNRIKHEILGKYFSAYMRALGRHAQAFHYIDGFAGGGLYEQRHHGSPLIALTLLAKQTVPCSVSFVERNPKLFSQLSQAITQHSGTGGLHDDPFVQQGKFSDFVEQILSRQVYSEFSRVATFAFVDPCGVQGVRMRDLAAVLSKPYGECLLFWNYDGINRWLGGVHRGTAGRDGLIDLFGDEPTVAEALRLSSPANPSPEKERELRDLFIKAVREHSGAQFVLPFRVDARDSDRTSHYLIHCSGHSLAFKIMKDVMGTATSSEEIGAFEFLREADTAYQLGIFAPNADRARTAILKQLDVGNCKVRLFTKDWILRQHDYFRERDYKQVLLDMEQAGDIEVLDKNGVQVLPREKRPKRDGKPTLGDDYWLRRKKR